LVRSQPLAVPVGCVALCASAPRDEKSGAIVSAAVDFPRYTVDWDTP
jgi:hypothetical protein